MPLHLLSHWWDRLLDRPRYKVVYPDGNVSRSMPYSEAQVYASIYQGVVHHVSKCP